MPFFREILWFLNSAKSTSIQAAPPGRSRSHEFGFELTPPIEIHSAKFPATFLAIMAKLFAYASRHQT